MMPGLLEKFLQVKVHCSCLLPLLSTTCSSGKKCIKGKLPQFSVVLIFPLGKSNPGSSDVMQTGLKFGICIHVPGICQSFAQIKGCKNQKNERTHEVMVGVHGHGMTGSSQGLGRRVEVAAIIQDTESSHRSHKRFTATILAATTASSLLRGHCCNTQRA